MPSPRFMEMQRNITTLRRFMLPGSFDPTGLYSDRVHQRAAAFRLLAHAEFESYLEDAVIAHVRERVARWKRTRRPSVTIASLIAYDEAAGISPTSLLNPPQKPAPTFDERLDETVRRFHSQVQDRNHGIREQNILSLVLPIGISTEKLDLDWIQLVDSWAQERGSYAHQSGSKVQKKLDPAREYSTAKRIVDGLREIDQLVSRLE